MASGSSSCARRLVVFSTASSSPSSSSFGSHTASPASGPAAAAAGPSNAASLMPRRRRLWSTAMSTASYPPDSRRSFHTSIAQNATTTSAASSFDHHASSANSSSSNSDAPPRFPFPTHTPHPSPYDIFHLDRTATAADIKSRYYDLVRIFHPDRACLASSSSSSLTAEQQKERIEDRFKLIVRAYELLSDRGRRRLYDRTGSGWGSRAGMGGGAGERWSRAGWEHRGDPSSSSWSADGRWGGGHGHDRYGWQRQHHDHQYFYGFSSRARHQQEESQNNKPRYLPNGAFFSLLLLATWSVACVQYARLSAQSARATQLADKVHLDAAHSLRLAREGARGEEGRRRREAVRRRVREMGVLEEVRALEDRGGGEEQGAGGYLALEAPSTAEAGAGAGAQGRPSGGEAYLERLSQLKDDQLPRPSVVVA